MVSLPSLLAHHFVVDGQVALKVALDLTIYLVGPSEDEFERLTDIYERLCLPDRRLKYTIGELDYWPDIAYPDLTDSGREAAAAGIRRPFFAPVRLRLRHGRSFEAGIWDGRSIKDVDGSWNFRCCGQRLSKTGLHSYVRIVIPWQADPRILLLAARAIADTAAFYSGHGGLAFAYDPWVKEGAFDQVYALARRFWGVDVEDMSETLPLMKDGIKGVNWITLLGPRLESKGSAEQIEAGLDNLVGEPNLSIERRAHGTLLFAGPEPVVGDQHRSDRNLAPYYAIARALSPLIIADHPDFPGERFAENGNTVGWIRRFITPSGWR
jgi:hypothetical protein